MTKTISGSIFKEIQQILSLYLCLCSYVVGFLPLSLSLMSFLFLNESLGFQIRFQCLSKGPFDFCVMFTNNLLVLKIPILESTYFPQEKNKTNNLVMTETAFTFFQSCSKLFMVRKKQNVQGIFFSSYVQTGAHAGVNRNKS